MRGPRELEEGDVLTEEEAEAYSGNGCRETCPEHGYYCTRHHGHNGPHIALRTASSGEEYEVCCAPWQELEVVAI